MTDQAASSDSAPPPAPSLRERRRAWFDRRARLKVTVGTWPANLPPTNYSYLSGERLVFISVVVSISVVAAIAAIVIAWPLTLLVLALLFNVLVRAQPEAGLWTDRCMAPALARAAQDLGTQTDKHEWRVTGARAVALAADVARLQGLPTPTRPDGTYPTAIDYERLHNAAAGPVLRRYLRPVLTAGEHGNESLGMVDDAAPLAPGAPWPVLESGNSTWDQPRRRPNRT